MLQQHWQEMTFKQKSPQTLRRLADHWGTEACREACLGMAQDFNQFVQVVLGMKRTAQRWIHRVLCVWGAQSVLQALPHPSPALRVQEHTKKIQNRTCFLHSKESCLLFPVTAAFLELADTLFPHPLPTWSLSATSTVSERNPLEWLNKCCWNYPQQEANTFCDLEKLKVIKGDDWE